MESCGRRDEELEPEEEEKEFFIEDGSKGCGTPKADNGEDREIYKL